MPPAALAAGGVLFHTTKPNPRTKHNLPIIFSSFEKTKRFFIFLLTNHPPTAIISHVLCTRTTYGGIAQLARAHGSYPWCPRFESRCRYHFFNFRLCLFILNGPVVKRSRHRPFTAVTRVRFPSGSPPFLCRICGGIAQPVERPPHTRKVTDSSSVVSTKPETFCFRFLFCFSSLLPNKSTKDFELI